MVLNKKGPEIRGLYILYDHNIPPLLFLESNNRNSNMRCTSCSFSFHLFGTNIGILKYKTNK